MAVKISIVGKPDGFDVKCLQARCRLTAFISGEEALRKMAVKLPDIALVNFQLPMMDGFECARKLKARWSKLPVFMLSANQLNDQSGLIFPAAHAGASGYLPGTLPAEQMLEAMKQVQKGMQRSRRIFLMFFDSDRSFRVMAKHWEKIATLMHAPSMSIHYGNEWRKVTIVGKIKKMSPPVVTPLAYFNKRSAMIGDKHEIGSLFSPVA